MAAIPPLHEDPPVGAGGIAPPSATTAGLPSRRPEVKDPAETSTLPKDWSPVTPSPNAEETPASPADSR
jgi:hypothetical protein